MTYDPDKKVNIAYNPLNLPLEITIDNTSAKAKNYYTYSATGAKLKVESRFDEELKITPLIGTSTGTDGLTPYKTTDYIGNKIYEDQVLSMILTDNGYYDNTDKKYYFYVRDHLGNNRIVADTDARVVQSNQYYPFGLEYPDEIGKDKQPYKYNGKELDSNHNLNLYDYLARSYNPAVPRFLSPDPKAENYPWYSPYIYVANNPLLNIDPDGEDYWSTNDPALIKQFLNSVGRGAKYYDFSGWQHATDAQFTANLTYNDETGKFFTSYTNVENGEINVVGKFFDANLKPVSLTGQGRVGNFVYEPRKGFMDHLYYYTYGLNDPAPWMGAGDASKYFDGSLTWDVNTSGRITGVAPIEAGKKGIGKALEKIFIKGFGMINKKNFHDILKPDIIKAAGGKKKLNGIVGNNPDITVSNGKIVLQGTKDSPFRGKTYNTNLNANDFLQ